MSEQITISLSNIRNTKSVLIEGIGTFTVRRLGSGEQLDLSLKARRIDEIINELNDVNFTKYDLAKPAHRKKVVELEKYIEALSKELTTIKTDELNLYKACFVDEDNGKKVDELIDSLTDMERAVLFENIFGEKKPVKPLDVIDTPVEDTSNE